MRPNEAETAGDENPGQRSEISPQLLKAAGGATWKEKRLNARGRTRRMRRVLDLGSGHHPRPAGPGEEVVTMDHFTTAKVDVRHSFLDLPYPFPDASFDEVYTSHVMEHVPPKLLGGDRDVFYAVMDEIHRILKPGGIFTAITPFAGSTADYCHVAHYRHFVPETWERFCESVDHAESEGYSTTAFRMRAWDVTRWEPRFPFSWPLGRYRRHPLAHFFVRFEWLKRGGIFGRPLELQVQLEKIVAPAQRG